MRLRALHELDRSDGTVQLHSANKADSGSVVLLPHPSENDPNDPLRWPAWKKHVAFGSVCAFTFLTNFAIGGLAPAFYILSLEFDKTVAETSDLLIWPILVLGAFNFFWVPVANYFGKRPVFVFASLLLTVCYVWGATARSFQSLLWSNIIAAFAGSSTEALGASIVNDLYFLHERGTKMSIYMFAISGGNTIGPIICGVVISALGWRWHKWLAVILTGLNFIAVLLFVPETRYDRDDDLNFTISESHMPAVSSSDACKEKHLVQESGTESDREQSASSRASADGIAMPEIPKKTYLQEISLWSGVPADTNLLKMFFRPLPLIVYPSVIYAFLAYAVALVLTVAVNILNSFVLQAPPYNWSPSKNGLINVPGIIGNLGGSVVGGLVGDKYSDWRARRNNGVFEPESRLWLLIPPTLITGAGCVLFGFGVQEKLHWASLFVGYGMVSFALTAVPSITMTYVSDSVLPVNSDALMLVNGLKNIVAFGFLYGIVPWVEQAGYVNCFGTQAGIFVGIIAIGAVLLIAFGARLRKAQATWRIIL